MQLDSEQRSRLDRDGYLFFPSLFKPDEIAVLLDEVPRLYAEHRQENVREKGSDAVRTNFAAHLYSAPFARLARHPRMIEPAMQVFGEPVYMHQFKINGKMAFDGDVWQWHQDYGTWKNDDLMPEARAMNVAIFLDEVNEFNGPLMFIPGSHTPDAINILNGVLALQSREDVSRLVWFDRSGREISTLGAGRYGNVRLSRDGVVVVHHDRTLDRTTALRGPIVDRTADELSRAGVPTLADVLTRYREPRVIIEMKVNRSELARATIDVVRAGDAVDRVA